MKERPILFNGDMVRAILDGKKTQTRRAFKLPPWAEWYVDGACRGEETGDLMPKNPRERGWYSIDELACPYGQPGDRLWVRETWQGPLMDADQLENEYRADPDKFHNPQFCEYAADGGPAPEFVTLDDELVCRWRPSIHMPRWASRILLEIISVRVERLHEITIGQICKEGLARSIYEFKPVTTAFDAFAELWNSTGGDWDANPWVWVVEFKRIDQTHQHPNHKE